MVRPRTLTVAGAAEALDPRTYRGSAPFSRFTWPAQTHADRHLERDRVVYRNCSDPISSDGGVRGERGALRFESTLNMGPYALTHQDFCHYSVPMDAELAALEQRIRQTADLCRRLRDENDGLRVDLAALESEKHLLIERMDSARDRLEALLKQIPEQG